MGIKNFFKSFKDAWRGICLTARGRNYKIELFAAAWALLLVWTGRGGAMRYAAVLAACALVLGAEGLNTALEKLCDRVSAEREDAIRDVKDIGAGAVLVCAFAALGIGAAVFADGAFWKTVFDRILHESLAWAGLVLVMLPLAALATLLPSKRGEKPDVQYYTYIEGKSDKAISADELEEKHGDN